MKEGGSSMSEQLKGGFESETPPIPPLDPERIYFDADELPPVDQIDLSILRRPGKKDYRSTLATKGTDQRSAVRYLNAAAEGSLDDETFEHMYEIAEKQALDGVISNDQFYALHEALEVQKPRVTELLQRVRNEQIFLEEESVAINRVALLLSGARTMNLQS
jgi:hypothetical protein